MAARKKGGETLSLFATTAALPSGRGTAGEGRPGGRRTPKKPSKLEPDGALSRQIAFDVVPTGDRYTRARCAFTTAILGIRFEMQRGQCALDRAPLPILYKERKGRTTVISEAHHYIPIAIAERLQIPIDFVRSLTNCRLLCPGCHTALTDELRSTHFCVALVKHVLFEQARTPDHRLLQDYHLPYAFLNNPEQFLAGLAWVD